jgi:hypothetical protein
LEASSRFQSFATKFYSASSFINNLFFLSFRFQLRKTLRKRKRVDGRVKTPAMTMGTGAATSGVITVKPQKLLYVSMLHPVTTEESSIKLISTAMKSTPIDFNCVKLLRKNMKEVMQFVISMTYPEIFSGTM